jgi:single-stranded-DNA-specific exonuclease
VTCDCGTSSLQEVERARELGLEVIVVDHHLPPSELPDASAFLNPKLPDADYAFTDYASGGVSFRLAEALYASARRPFPEQRYVELAALATVADMVPLLDENREIVRRGLAAMAETQRPGLQALMQVAGVEPKRVSSESIAFSLAPRINAAGRLADARLALDMLLATEDGTALSLATTIDALNRERQRMTLEAQELARRKLEDGPETPILIVGDAGFHQGIIGLVASRLVESFGRPAAVYQQGDVESRGSCRSIVEYDITGGLRSCGELFERFGGHKAAAGFTIRSDRLIDMEQRLTEHASGLLRDVELSPCVEIDAAWPLEQLRSAEIKWLGKLQPHGVGNPDPTFLSRGVSVLEAKRVGEDSRHLKLRLKHGPVVWPAIAFGWEGEVPEDGVRVDLVYSLSPDRFGPSEQGGALMLTVVDLAPST